MDKRKEIEHILLGLFSLIGMDTPNNIEQITKFCYDDVCETADPTNWNDDDVTIAFRRWIETQRKEEDGY